MILVETLEPVQQAAAAAAPALSTPEGFGMLLGVLVLMSIVPFLLTLTTSFAKFVIVLGLVRQALGTQQTPPNVIVTGIALLLTVHVIWPVAEASYANYRKLEAAAPAADPGTEPFGFDWRIAVKAVRGPMHEFLEKNSNPEYVEQFRSLGEIRSGDSVKPAATGTEAQPTLRSALKETSPELAAALDDLVVYAPAFLLTELTEAFQIGFLLFIPFLVIDLVVGNVLLAMGMQMLSPQTVSLPLKLLLFVVIDGWRLILTGLVAGYV